MLENSEQSQVQSLSDVLRCVGTVQNPNIYYHTRQQNQKKGVFFLFFALKMQKNI